MRVKTHVKLVKREREKNLIEMQNTFGMPRHFVSKILFSKFEIQYKFDILKLKISRLETLFIFDENINNFYIISQDHTFKTEEF